MKKHLVILTTIILLIISFTFVSAAIAPLTIYKTKANYNNLVPVELSKDKSTLASFPGIGDVYYNGELAYPTELNQGYLLDNRGVGPYSAFLDITYEEYSQLEQNPSITELFNSILDNDPFIEMYDCTQADTHREKDKINQLIDEGKLEEECELIIETEKEETPEWVQDQIDKGTIGIKAQKRVLTQTRIQEIKKVQNRIRAFNGTGECPNECTCTGSTTKCGLKGERTMTITAGNSGNTIVQVKGVNASTSVTLYKSEEKLYGVFNGETKRVMTPEQVQEKIKAKTNAKLDEQEITLDEDGKYRVKTKKQSRLFFMFKVKERVNAEVDPETGEVLKLRNSWWGFLAKDIKEDFLVGASCGTVNPDNVDECCVNKGYDVWNEEALECVFSE